MIPESRTPGRTVVFSPIVSIVVACLFPVAAFAATIYVDSSNQTGIEDGTQSDPYRSIQIGINATMAEGDVVLVAPGAYFETILVRDGVHVVCSDPPNCVIDATGRNRSVVVFENTKLYPSLEGFTVTGGTGDWSGVTAGGTSVYLGGGIRISGAAIVRGNVIEGNELTEGICHGAGINVVPQIYTPQIVGNVIRDNDALCTTALSESKGGGVYIVGKFVDMIITDNVIEGNRAHIGGGLYSRNIAAGAGSILRNVFQFNEATQGAALYTEDFGFGSTTTIGSNFFYGNGSSEGTIDCDDADPTSGPGLPEICNDGLDNDCDPATPDIFDGDGDGFACDVDCDDTDPAINPSAFENCVDGIDNTCDGLTDAEDPDCVCVDNDGDGYACADCDDNDPLIHPGADEICNDGLDNDCDASTVDLSDADSDGFNCAIDCDETDPQVNPDAPEVNCDNLDNDCNPGTPDVVDADGDLFDCTLDCNDTNPIINPDGFERCDDGIDNNCDGFIDGLDLECSCPNPSDLDGDGYRCSDCNDADASVNPGLPELCNDGVNNDCRASTPDIFDGDSDGFLCDVDCRDFDSSVSPNALEICDDTLDNDCDGLIDSLDDDCACADADGDGYACSDCNDSDPGVNPGAQEVCNDGVDNDCDAATLDLIDYDGDGFSCVLDCDDEDASVHPDAGENCLDLIDNDCDTQIDILDPDLVLVQFGSSFLYLANLADPGMGLAWTQRVFDDRAWPSGIYGVGYQIGGGGANDLIVTDVEEGAASVYTRAQFIIQDLSGVNQLDLGGDYDDAFVAWINGVEVYRSPEMPPGDPLWNADPGLHESSNGVVPNYGALIDISGTGIPALVQGANIFAVGVYNDIPAAGISSDLVVVPRLSMSYGSDDPDCLCADDDVDGYACDDCDDTSSAIHPGQPELGCNLVDDDCDSATSDTAVDADADGYDCTVDCKDDIPTVHPNAPEIGCNGLDDDCDSATSDIVDADIDGVSCLIDCDDQDATISPGQMEIACDGIDNDCNTLTPDVFDADLDGFHCVTDCDDTDPAVHPNAVEKCDDAIDNDCNDLIDTADADCSCADNDVDGYACGDCDDLDPTVNPGAAEVCNDGIDNDCDSATLDLGDADGDGFDCSADCDDSDPFVSPASAELCSDGIDNDCDVSTPDIFDADADGYTCDVDCRDDIASINPNAIELCADSIDNDCDPTTLDSFDSDNDGYACDLECDDSDASINPGATEICNDGIDNDCDAATADLFDADGDGSTCDVDCNDSNRLVRPGGAEKCDDGVDNDCDTLIDGTDPDCACGDGDGDGYPCLVDCDDSDPSISPGAFEICADGIDNDCDSSTLDIGDRDGDGFLCDVDCDETDPNRNPGAAEICLDGIDNDCNPATPDLGDLDGDLWLCADDCDDADPDVNPGMAEVTCDGVDNDCDVFTLDLDDGDGDGVGCADLNVKGGGIHSAVTSDGTVTIVNNTLVQNNMLLGTGGAIWLDTMSATLTSVAANNIIVANTALVGSGVDHTLYYGEILNNAFFDNNGDDLYNGGGSGASITDNMFVDPMFSSSSAGNYRLDEASPLIDAADASFETTADVDGFFRPFDGDGDAVAIADLGAFEFPSGEVFGLFMGGQDTITWQVRAGETSFNVYRGDLQRLRASGNYTQDPSRPLSDRFCGIDPGALPFNDAFVPPPGSVVYYLIALTNTRGSFEGSLGEDSSGALRFNAFFCP